jgi:hypothetical protein
VPSAASRVEDGRERPLGEGVARISTFSVGWGYFPLPLPRVEFLRSPPPQAGEGTNTTAGHFLTQ